MDALTTFGLIAVTAMLVCYALEDRSRWFILAFAAACGLGSAYGFLQGAWPFGVVEAIWALVALRRWRRAEQLPGMREAARRKVGWHRRHAEVSRRRADDATLPEG